MSSALPRISYDAAIRALDLQERSVEQLRARTGTLLAATSLTASFLGAQTIQHTQTLGVLGILALAALALAVVTCIYVLLPKRGFVFSVSAVGIYEALYPHVHDDDEVHRTLVYWLEGYYAANQLKIDVLVRFYALAAVALTAQLVLWSVALASNIA